MLRLLPPSSRRALGDQLQRVFNELLSQRNDDINSGYSGNRFREAIKAILQLSYTSDISHLSTVSQAGRVSHLHHRRILRNFLLFSFEKFRDGLRQKLKIRVYLTPLSFWVFFVFHFRALVPPCGSCTETYLSPQRASCSDTTLLFLCPPLIKNAHSPRAREVSVFQFSQSCILKLLFLFKKMSFHFGNFSVPSLYGTLSQISCHMLICQFLCLSGLCLSFGYFSYMVFANI